jgi:iron(III) transport system ATP-binding protein
MKQIEISHLDMGYGGASVVKDLSIEVNSGETLVLLGPSGCGKTSTMRCIAGLETPTRGKIMLGERVVFDSDRGVNLGAHKRNVGMVFQSYAIWPHMSVGENVAFPLTMANVDRSMIAERVTRTLALVGLEGMADRGGSQLSGGQMQRVALARSLAMSPKVILFDEPLSNLDAKLREGLRVELKQIQQDLGFTSVYVTHDQSEALALGDRIAVMRSGVIVQIADPVELYRRPNSSFVADFLGVTNIFEGKPSAAAGGGTCVRLKDFGTEIKCDQPVPTDWPSATVCIRPAAIIVGDKPFGEINSWKGKVVVSSFLGGVVRYRIALDGGLILDASCAEKDGLPRAAGSPVYVHIASEDVNLVRE